MARIEKNLFSFVQLKEIVEFYSYLKNNKKWFEFLLILYYFG